MTSEYETASRNDHAVLDDQPTAGRIGPEPAPAR